MLSREGSPYTNQQVELIMYVYNHLDKVVYQRDLPEVLGITRPTANGLVKRLVQKKAIKLVADPKDSRLKQIKIMPAVIADINSNKKNFINEFRQMEDQLTKGFSKKQQDEFEKMLVKAIANLES
ncbi:MarR family winged helix-turn-helix transcriptional regulator [Lactobacillus ultunensis]|nr:helix-turn-helix domain-containing protein [Lactobacillus ultunensis]